METTATPAAPAAATPAAAPAATVTLTKEQHDQLTRDAARAAANQREADLWRKNNGGGKVGSHFAPKAPVTPPSKEEMETQALNEDKKAERALLALAADPAYREVFDADPTLRTLITTNPLAVLPIFAKDAFDADDALNLVKEALGKLIKPKAAPANPPAAPTTPPAPPAGGINPTDQATQDAVAAAKKLPNTEHAISSMVAAKIRAGKK